jgi:archaellum biogenesis protein FlaJ (TadC family)
MFSNIYLGGSKRIHYLVSALPITLSLILPVLSIAGLFRTLAMWEAALIILMGGTLSMIMSLYPRFLISSMLDRLEQSMPHLILRTRTLIMAGESPLQTFISASQEIKSPILDYLIKSIITGETPEAVLDEIEGFFGKKPVIDRLKRIVLSLGMGTQAISFLKDEFETVMAEKDTNLRKALDSLSTVVELYMTVGVFFPVIAIVLLSSLSILGGPSGIDVYTLIALLIFVAIPLFSALAAVMAKKIVEGATL